MDDKKEIKKLKGQLQDATISLKLIITFLLLTFDGFLIMSYGIIIELASFGISQATGRLNELQSFLVQLGFGVSRICLMIAVFSTIVGGIWFIWEYEITLGFDKLSIAIHGAQKELQAEQEKPIHEISKEE